DGVGEGGDPAELLADPIADNAAVTHGPGAGDPGRRRLDRGGRALVGRRRHAGLGRGRGIRRRRGEGQGGHRIAGQELLEGQEPADRQDGNADGNREWQSGTRHQGPLRRNSVGTGHHRPPG
ncbi:MAG: hypothetical protein EPO00_05825, partial [Chloroflexota bacterium]